MATTGRRIWAVPCICIFMVVLLSGCSKAAPKCNDPKTIELVKKVYTEHLRDKLNIKADAISALNIELRNIRTTDSDKKTGKQDCACEMEISAKDSGSTTFPVQYSSELTDSKEHYVSALLTERMFPLPLIMYLVSYKSPLEAKANQEACEELKMYVRNSKMALDAYYADNKKYPLAAESTAPSYIKLELSNNNEQRYSIRGTSEKCDTGYVTESESAMIMDYRK